MFVVGDTLKQHTNTSKHLHTDLTHYGDAQCLAHSWHSIPIFFFIHSPNRRANSVCELQMSQYEIRDTVAYSSQCCCYYYLTHNSKHLNANYLCRQPLSLDRMQNLALSHFRLLFRCFCLSP